MNMLTNHSHLACHFISSSTGATQTSTYSLHFLFIDGMLHTSMISQIKQNCLKMHLKNLLVESVKNTFSPIYQMHLHLIYLAVSTL